LPDLPTEEVRMNRHRIPIMNETSNQECIPMLPEEVPEHPHHDYFVTVSPDDIDMNDHTNNVVYLRWVQEAAMAHWERTVPAKLAVAHAWVVTRHEIDYKHIARLGETLRVRTWVESMSALTSERLCEIRRDADSKLIARVRTLLCTVNPATGRPRRMDPGIPGHFGLK
jgi:acyl-CoA thioester hydrolase